MKLYDFIIAWAILIVVGWAVSSWDENGHAQKVNHEGCVVTKVEKGVSGFVPDKDGNTTFVTTPSMMEWTCKDGTTFWR